MFNRLPVACVVPVLFVVSACGGSAPNPETPASEGAAESAPAGAEAAPQASRNAGVPPAGRGASSPPGRGKRVMCEGRRRMPPPAAGRHTASRRDAGAPWPKSCGARRNSRLAVVVEEGWGAFRFPKPGPPDFLLEWLYRSRGRSSARAVLGPEARACCESGTGSFAGPPGRRMARRA